MESASHSAPTVRLEAPPGLRARAQSVLAAAQWHVGAGSCCVVLVVGDHLPECLDSLMADSTPHLLVRLAGDRCVLGPFVVPGVTACARCVVLAKAETDPAPAAVLARAFGAGPQTPGPLRWPHPPMEQGPEQLSVLTAALGLAAHDLHRWSAGAPPLTWSATLTIGPDGASGARRFRAHPWCGCAWFGSGLT